MILAELILSTETAVAVFAVVSTLTGIIGTMAGIILAFYRSRIAALESENKSWREMTMELNNNMEVVADRHRRSQGNPVVPPVAPVIPEHFSPPSFEQLKTATLQTERARVTASTLALDLPAREHGV